MAVSTSGNLSFRIRFYKQVKLKQSVLPIWYVSSSSMCDFGARTIRIKPRSKHREGLASDDDLVLVEYVQALGLQLPLCQQHPIVIINKTQGKITLSPTSINTPVTKALTTPCLHICGRRFKSDTFPFTIPQKNTGEIRIHN